MFDILLESRPDRICDIVGCFNSEGPIDVLIHTCNCLLRGKLLIELAILLESRPDRICDIVGCFNSEGPIDVLIVWFSIAFSPHRNGLKENKHSVKSYAPLIL